MFEDVGYHNQLKYFQYTTNPGPALHLTDYFQKFDETFRIRGVSLTPLLTKRSGSAA